MPLVAYTDPQGVFGKHERIVQQQSKSSKNSHWRPLNAVAEDVDSRPKSAGSIAALTQIAIPDTTIRTIPSLDSNLVPESGDKPRQHQIPGLSNAPLVQILVIETAPLEIYREKSRQIGKNWFNSNVAVRDPTGYVVVHVVSPQDSSKLVKSIWTRLNNDFNSAHCVQLNLSDPSGSSGWLPVQQLVAKQSLSAFDQRIQILQTEIRKLKATQDVPGWNFGAFIAIHESSASAYASSNLVDDAFKVYQYLEEVISQKPRDIWAPEPRMVNSKTGLHNAMTDCELVRMRDTSIDLVLSQKSSYFDVQQNSSSNQVDSLMRMALHQSQHSDSLADTYVNDSVKLVITRLPLSQESLESSLGRRRALIWLLSAIRRFLARVTEIGSPRLAACKADLVLIERDYLQALGESNGWHIPGVFNDVSLEDESETPSEDKKVAEEDAKTDIAQLEGLRSEDEFVETFFSSTNSAISYYANANSHRAVLRSQAQILLITFHQKKFTECWEIYEKHPQLLTGQLMPATAIFEAVLACSRESKLRDKTSELSWKALDLMDAPRNLVKSAVSEIENASASQPASAASSPASSPSKQSTITSATTSSGSQIALIPKEKESSRWFTPHLVPYIRADANGYYLDLKLTPVRARFPFVKFCSVVLSAEVVDPISGSKRKLFFETKADPEIVGTEGSLMYKSYTSTFVEGVIDLQTLESSHKGSTKFTHTFSQISAAMHPLASSFTAQITLAKNHSMKKRNIELRSSSPAEVKQAEITSRPVDPQLQSLMDKAKGADPKSLSNFTDATVEVPVLVDLEMAVMRVKVTIEYRMAGDASSVKKYEFYEHLNFALAVSVDFQESFRQPPRILTQFLVKPFNQVPAVFLGADLQDSTTYEVSRSQGSGHYDRPMVAYNNAPVSYVFNMAKRDKPEPKAKSTSVQFSLQYRSISWECQSILFEACMKNLGSSQCYKPILSQVSEQSSPYIDLAEYVCSGIVNSGDDMAARTVVIDAFQYMDPKHAQEIADIVIAASKETQKPESLPKTRDFTKLNSTMHLDVPDPDAEVVHYISLKSKSSSEQKDAEATKRRAMQFAVGEPIHATLTIKSITFRPEPPLETQLFEYELDRASDGWSYTGLVKGQFRGGTTVSEEISLIPTRSGESFLPNVVVRPVPTADAVDDGTESVQVSRRDSAFSGSLLESETPDDQVVVSEHANTRSLIVPDINMLAISF